MPGITLLRSSYLRNLLQSYIAITMPGASRALKQS